MSISRRRALQGTFIAWGLGACASAPPPVQRPDFQAAAFDARAIEVLALAPVVDLRPDRSEVIEIDKWVHTYSNQILPGRGYKAMVIASAEARAGLEGAGQVEVLAESLKRYRVAGAPRWVLVFVLVDYKAKLTFGSTGNAEMVALLLDQQNGEVVWRHRALGQFGQGGLIGMMVKNLAGQTAVQLATDKLLSALPSRL